MSRSASALAALLGVPPDATLTLTQIDLTAWGRTLVLRGSANDQLFEIRYTDCREFRWRVYVSDDAGATPLVSFAPGRDRHRSPAQILTAHFGLSLFYGSAAYSSRIADADEC